MMTPKIYLLLIVAVAVLAQDGPVEESRMFEDQDADMEEVREFLENVQVARAADDETTAEEDARSLGDLEDDSRDARQLDYVRPIKRKSFFGRFSRPTITRRCRKAGNMVLKDDCTSYLSCSRRYFGMLKTCPKDELFDAQELKCGPARQVSCRI